MNTKAISKHFIKANFFSLIIVVICLFNESMAQGQIQQATNKYRHLFGSWTATLKANHLFVTLKNKALPKDGSTIIFSAEEIVGLSDGSGAFSIVRDAGAMHFEGLIKNGEGSGTYRFTPNAYFMDQMREEDMEVAEDEQINFFLANVTKSYVKMLKKQGYTKSKKPGDIFSKKQALKDEDELRVPPMDGDPLSNLINFKSVGITEEFIKNFEAAGYKDISPGTYVNFKSVGVTPQFIKNFEQAGLKKPAYSDIINFKLVGVTPEYIKSFHEAGYPNVAYSMIINLKAAGVSPPKKQAR